MSFSIESDVSLKSTSELQDPELDDNDETISVPVSSPTS
jgi:hypothetical protein